MARPVITVGGPVDASDKKQKRIPAKQKKGKNEAKDDDAENEKGEKATDGMCCDAKICRESSFPLWMLTNRRPFGLIPFTSTC